MTPAPTSSRAIPIVAPADALPTATGSKDPPPHTPKKGGDPASRIQCRNVVIFGSCKNEGKSCTFYHPPKETTSEAHYKQPLFPAASSPALVNVNAPVFVPKGGISIPSPALGADAHDAAAPHATADETRIGKQSEGYDEIPATNEVTYNPYDLNDTSTVEYPTTLPLTGDMYGSHVPMMPGHEPYSMAAYSSQHLGYHLYNQQPRPSGSSGASNELFISDNIRQELQQKSEDLWSAQSASDPGLPSEVHDYHSLSLLKTPGDQNARSTVGSYGSVVYRAVNKNDGKVYVLRRIEAFRLNFEAALGTIDDWSRLRHPNIITVKEAFTTRDFGDSSLVFVSDYHPRAQSLYQMHLASPATRTGSPSISIQTNHHRGKHGGKNGSRDNTADSGMVPLSEQVIWSYVVQLGSAIRAVHERGKAIRCLDPKTVMATGKNRLRIDCCGVMDVIGYNPAIGMEFLQQEDLHMFGKLLLLICCLNANASANLAKAMETITRLYSQDVGAAIVFLLSKAGPKKTIDELFAKLGPKILLVEMNSLHTYTDDLEHSLMGELENARLVRLLSKLGFINERPQFNHDPRWSETGDRYIIKLFRDYLFHQVDQDGKPAVNMSHILSCLNKLDAGSPEQLMLVSRDEQSCLVVSYEAIKMCTEQAFRELSL
ncbi:PAB-dependent poly(A)-specific ribonuclease subunit 3 [Tulasnella sp. JGI-2019a]|nr:PAB-dependent poly(A)-specific ribonuclease subunit 3 [Tulasnella sp. JGI-2019a]